MFFVLIPAGIALYLVKYARPRLKAEGNPALGKATAALVIALVSAIAGVGLYVVIAVQERADDVVFNDLKVGDCFEEPVVEELVAVNRQSCGKPHDLEVYGVVVHPAPKGDPWPGQDALLDFAIESCLDQFQDYVGAPFETSRYSDVELFPLEEGWNEEDFRKIVCAAGGPAGAQLPSSIRGAGSR